MWYSERDPTDLDVNHPKHLERGSIGMPLGGLVFLGVMVFWLVSDVDWLSWFVKSIFALLCGFSVIGLISWREHKAQSRRRAAASARHRAKRQAATENLIDRRNRAVPQEKEFSE